MGTRASVSKLTGRQAETPINTARVKEHSINRIVGSAETFDTLCDVCKNPEKKTVGFCRDCRQTYCSRCKRCDHTGRYADRGLGKQKGASLFEKHKVPASVQQIPYGYRDADMKENGVTCLAFSGLSEDIFMFDEQPNGTMLKVVRKNGSEIIEPITRLHPHMFCAPYSKKDQYIYFTLFVGNQVQRLNIDDNTIRQVTHFETAGCCYGIAHFDRGFAVSMMLDTGFDMPDWQIQYLDIEGSIKRRVYCDMDDNALFSHPGYLASNRTQDTLFVSDKGKQAIIALDVRGNVLYTFSHSDLKSPKALSVDDEDNVYVANVENVIQIHQSGTKHRVLVKKRENNPDILSVCFNSVAQSLIVGENSNKLKIFIFSP